MFCLKLLLLFISVSLGARLSSSQVSVYDSVQNVIHSLDSAGQAISLQYKDLTQNDTSPLSNWIAYSNLLRQINRAIIDHINEVFTTSSLKISDKCIYSMFDFIEGIDQQKTWAYRILDANGLFATSGILDGSFSNFGDFDECYWPSAHATGSQMEGRYCLVKYKIDVPSNKTHLITQDLVFNTTGTVLAKTFFSDFLRYAHYFKVRTGRLGLCLPSGCSQSDIQVLIDAFFKIDKIHVKVDTCQTMNESTSFSTLQLAIIVVIITILSIAVLSTIVDILHSSNYYNLQDDKHAKWTKLVQCFSIYTNCQTLMNCKSSGGQLRSINGIRFLTMCWLVYGHAYLLPIKEAFRSSTRFIESLYDVKMYFIFNSWPAVDIFFLISALLHSFHVFRAISSNKSLNIPKIVTNRVARLWPSLWFTVGIVFVIPKLAQGPLWSEIMDQQVNHCYQTWWKIVLFLTNFRTEDDLCQLHTWYLSADMQLFLASFVFILLLYKFGRSALNYMTAGILCFCSLVSFYFYYNELAPTVLFNHIDEKQIYEDIIKVYMPTYLHLTPYLIGIMAGYILTVMKNENVKMNKLLNTSLWVLSLLLIVMVIISGYFFTSYTETPLINQSFYAGFHRFFWSLSVAFLIISCEIKQGGLISEFLSSSFFIPLSKLCYLVYLIHFIVTWTRYAYIRQPLVFSNYTLFNEFLINFVVSLFLAFVFYLLVEAPFTNLYSTYVGRKKWPFGEICFKETSQDENGNNVDLEEIRQTRV